MRAWGDSASLAALERGVVRSVCVTRALRSTMSEMSEMGSTPIVGRVEITRQPGVTGMCPEVHSERPGLASTVVQWPLRAFS